MHSSNSLPDRSRTKEAVVDIYLGRSQLWRGLPLLEDGDGSYRVALPESRTGSLRGTVLGRNGIPVPGVGLTLATKSFFKLERDQAWAGRAVSDAEGRFEFADVPEGFVDELTVHAPGYVAPRSVLEHAPIRAGEVVDLPIQLIPECVLVGRVIDEAGQPRVGIRIDSDVRIGGNAFWGAQDAHTGSDGRFVVRGLLPGTVTLEFKGDVFSLGAEATAEVVPTAITDLGDLVVPATPMASGLRTVVRTSWGEPVAGASVGVTLSSDTHESRRAWLPKTNHEGVSSTARLPQAATRVRVVAHHMGLEAEPQESVRDPATGRFPPVELVLPTYGTIRGRVLAGDRPAPWAYVHVDGVNRTHGVNEDGVFEIQGVRAGARTVHASTMWGQPLGPNLEVRVVSGGAVEVELSAERLDPVAEIRGRLLDVGGYPIPGVWVSPAEEGSTSGVPRVATDARGRFRLPVERHGDHPLHTGELWLRTRLVPGDEVDVVVDPSSWPVCSGRTLDRYGRQLGRGSGDPAPSTRGAALPDGRCCRCVSPVCCRTRRPPPVCSRASSRRVTATATRSNRDP